MLIHVCPIRAFFAPMISLFYKKRLIFPIVFMRLGAVALGYFWRWLSRKVAMT